MYIRSYAIICFLLTHLHAFEGLVGPTLVKIHAHGELSAFIRAVAAHSFDDACEGFEDIYKTTSYDLVTKIDDFTGRLLDRAILRAVKGPGATYKKYLSHEVSGVALEEVGRVLDAHPRDWSSPDDLFSRSRLQKVAERARAARLDEYTGTFIDMVHKLMVLYYHSGAIACKLEGSSGDLARFTRCLVGKVAQITSPVADAKRAQFCRYMSTYATRNVRPEPGSGTAGMLVDYLERAHRIGALRQGILPDGSIEYTLSGNGED